MCGGLVFKGVFLEIVNVMEKPVFFLLVVVLFFNLGCLQGGGGSGGVFDHYMVLLVDSGSSSGHSYETRVLAEVEDGGVVWGNFSDYFRSVTGYKSDCIGVYLPDNDSGCWMQECEVTQRVNDSLNEYETHVETEILPCGEYDLTLEDIRERIEERFGQIEERFGHNKKPEHKVYQIYQDKEGCTKKICYKNGHLTRYETQSFHWKRKPVKQKNTP